MNILTPKNFHKICRTCAREEDELISFHENSYLSEMLKLCAQIDFETTDDLPKQICLSCIDELNKTYTFTIKCRMVDAALRNFVREHNIANMDQEIPENSEFNVFIKTEHCENSNDGTEEVPPIISCSQCSEVFTSLSDLVSHQKLERHFCTKPEENPPNKRKRRPRKKEGAAQSENINPLPVAKPNRTFTCQICNKVMNNLSNFRRHEQIHSGEKKFTCTVCNKNFRHSGTLITHQRSHSGERPCICDICGKTYVDLSTLGRHKKIHTGEKKFQCDVCNKRFTQSGDLNVHKRLHFEKPFSCEICLKRFNRRTHLQKHGKVHLKNVAASLKMDEVARMHEETDDTNTNDESGEVGRESGEVGRESGEVSRESGEIDEVGHESGEVSRESGEIDEVGHESGEIDEVGHESGEIDEVGHETDETDEISKNQDGIENQEMIENEGMIENEEMIEDEEMIDNDEMLGNEETDV